MSEPKKDFKALRDLLAGIQAQLCATNPAALDEPFRGAFTSIKNEFDSMLAKLPPTEQVPGALDLSWQLQSLWSCFYSLNSLFTLLTTAGQKPEANDASMCARVDAEIAKRIAAGELLAKDGLAAKVQEQIAALTTAGTLAAKDTLTQLCADSKNVGLAEGEKKVRDEIAARAALETKLATRKGALTTAGLPLPDAEVEKWLGGTDEEFSAHKARMEAQLGEFAKRGIQLNADSAVRAKAWLAAEQFNGFIALADAIPALKAKAAEPFAQGAPTPVAAGSLPFPV